MRFVLAIVVAFGAATASAQNANEADFPAEQPKRQLDIRRSTTDSLGDPLPDGALLRLGTLRFRHPLSVFEMALSPDEKTVVTLGRQLIAWDTSSGKERWRVSLGEHGFSPPAAAYGIQALAFAPGSRRFYTPGKHNEIIAWNALSGRPEIIPIKLEKQPRHAQMRRSRSVDVAPDGQKLAVGSSDGLIVCDSSGKVLYKTANNPDGPLELENDRLGFFGHYSYGRFSPDGKKLAVVTSDMSDYVRLIDSRSGKQLLRFSLTAKLVRMAFSPDGAQIVTTERDSAVRQYAVVSGKEIWSYKIELKNTAESYTSAVAFSPDARIVAACAPIGSDFQIYLFDAATGKDIGRLVGHRWKPWALAFTADSKTLYSSGWDGAVRRWNVATREQLPLPAGVHGTGVIAASPDGRTLAYGDDSGKVRLVNVEDGTIRRTIVLPGTQYTQLAFSYDGRRLAGGGTVGNQVHIAVWDVTDGDVLHRWDWPKGRDPHSHIEALCFTPNGKRLAAAVFRQSSVYVWDLTKDRQSAQLKHTSVYGLSFSPDGGTLATAGWDKIVRF